MTPKWKEAREEEHMTKRRAKLAHDAAMSGDKEAEAAWLNPQATSNSLVREEILRIHQEYLPVLEELQRRSSDPRNMEGLSGSEEKRLLRAREWAGQELGPAYAGR